MHLHLPIEQLGEEGDAPARRWRVRGVRASDPLRAALRGAARRPAGPAGRAAAAYRRQGKAVGRVEPLRHRDARPGWKSRLTMFFDRRRTCRDITNSLAVLSMRTREPAASLSRRLAAAAPRIFGLHSSAAS